MLRQAQHERCRVRREWFGAARGASDFALGSTTTRVIVVLLALWLAAPAHSADVAASAPRDLSVTIYRAPNRGKGSVNLDALGGFALVTETRAVTLPAGISRLRFEGVADGIEAASAIVTGLPEGVIEKNRDAHLLSPSALVEAALGKPVTLVRRHPKTGRMTRVTGTIVADAGGVVFRSAEGIEALRCSGLPETFAFDPVTTGLSARPTLSVLTRSERPVAATVALSYLARGFDWAADYVATLAPDGRTLDLGAWVTLANGNGGGFPETRAQVVAGRLNRATGEVEPVDEGSPILAQCWPRGSTSDTPLPAFDRAEGGMMYRAPAAPPAPMLMEARDIVVTAAKVSQEQLGDLKLYRVPGRTTIAGRQSKQVRLLDRFAIPVARVSGADLPADQTLDFAPAQVLLRSVNDAAHHLGLPLPSGRVATFQSGHGRPLLVGEAGLADIAVGETVEFKLGDSPDVQVRQVHEAHAVDAGGVRLLPLVPGLLAVRTAETNDVTRVEIANAGARPIAFELRLGLPDGARIVRADHPMAMKNGRPIFRLTLPANGATVVRYRSGSATNAVVIGPDAKR